MSLIFPDGSRTVPLGGFGGQKPQAPRQSQQGGQFNYNAWRQSPERYSPESQQAWQQAGSPKSFRPGQAQPIQPQSQGSPYGQQPPFTQAMQTPFGQMNPNQYYQQRDAFIQTANDQMGQYMANGGVYQGQGAPPPTWGQQPQFNPMQMWGQAGDMVQQGWQNPYAQPAQTSQYDDWASRPAYRQVGAPTNAQFYGENAQEQFQKYAAQNQQAPPQQKPPPDLLQQYNRLVMQPTSRQANYGQGYEAAFNKLMPEAQKSGLYTDQQLQALRDEHAKWMAHERKTAPDALARVSAANKAASGQFSDQADTLQKARATQRAGVSSQANQRWLASLTPANRRIYSMMQNMY
jgi:hypothetical protein